MYVCILFVFFADVLRVGYESKDREPSKTGKPDPGGRPSGDLLGKWPRIDRGRKFKEQGPLLGLVESVPFSSWSWLMHC